MFKERVEFKTGDLVRVSQEIAHILREYGALFFNHNLQLAGRMEVYEVYAEGFRHLIVWGPQGITCLDKRTVTKVEE